MSARTIALLAVAVTALTAGAASAETRWERHHPRQDQVLDRAHHQQRRINEERREGDLTAAQAHRLRVADRRVVRLDHRLAHINGGYITPAQQRYLDHRENRIGHRIPD